MRSSTLSQALSVEDPSTLLSDTSSSELVASQQHGAEMEIHQSDSAHSNIQTEHRRHHRNQIAVTGTSVTLASESPKQTAQKPYRYHNPTLSPVIHAPKSEFGDMLPMPGKYQVLEDLFKVLETVMMYFKKLEGKKPCTLHNLAFQIEQLTQT
jgi:hypothetical protein